MRTGRANMLSVAGIATFGDTNTSMLMFTVKGDVKIADIALA